MSDSNEISLFLGKIKVTPTSATHIFLCTDIYGPLTVNRVEMNVSAHFSLWADGSWHIGNENADWSSKYHALNATKVNRKNYNDDVSSAARTKLAEVLTPLVNEWAKQNPGLLGSAEIEDIEKQIERASGEVVEAMATLRKAEKKLAEIETKMAQAKGGE